MEDKTQIVVNGDQKELTIRYGKAAVLTEPVKISLSGDINAPWEFLSKRVADYKVNEVHVIMDEDTQTIILNVDEASAYSGTVKGSMTLNTELAGLGINDDKMYSQSELFSKIKFFKMFFKNENEFEKLVGKLMDFEVKVSTEFKNANDFKGKSARSKLVAIKHTLDLQFQLHIPIYKGFDRETFMVDICIDASNGDVDFWLESVQMKDRMYALIQKTFEDFREKFKDYVIINK